ncbi:hypothetical protein, partial [Acinetobacter pittii]|uniref:hypothetical protein n=1 Tax=Acinetobacter pittii TaxID=48296 RepID=UPI001BB2D1CB
KYIPVFEKQTYFYSQPLIYLINRQINISQQITIISTNQEPININSFKIQNRLIKKILNKINI